ncbi:MAG: NYN domain-containing protein [Okeania sp. SIO2H7]|nr:NYN domain-containing protein [Okeania sp. SIO2H7]
MLLDVENLQIDRETEKFLEEICTYPIQIKVAFANWRYLGKKDREFHKRGYQLIHVPPGKDSADLKMAAVGASIFVHYPTAKEVLVCSSDRAMIHLGNSLQSHGLIVYQVSKERGKIIVLNRQTGESKNLAIGPKIELPSLEEFLVQLQELMTKETNRTKIQWIELSRMSVLYQETYDLAIEEVVAFYYPDSPVRSIFLNHTDKFALHQPGEDSPMYVTLFNLEINRDTGEKSVELTRNISEIDSLEKMEEILVKIVNKLTSNSPDTYIAISNVAAEFNKIYKQPITKIIKRFYAGGKLSKFLPLCSSLKVNTGEKGRMEIAVIKPEEVINN